MKRSNQSQAPLTLPSSASTTSVQLVTDSPPGTGSTPSGEPSAGLTRSNSQQSHNSLHDTHNFYGVNSRPSNDNIRRSNPNLGSPSPSASTSNVQSPTLAGRSLSSAQPSILPHASFFNPRRAGQPGISASGSATGDRGSWRQSGLAGGNEVESRRLGVNGPIVTRVVNDYSSPQGELTTRRLSTDIDNQSFGSHDGPPGRPESRRQSLERELRRRSLSQDTLATGHTLDPSASSTHLSPVTGLPLPTPGPGGSTAALGHHTSREPLIDQTSGSKRNTTYPNPDSPLSRARHSLQSSPVFDRKNSGEDEVNNWNAQQQSRGVLLPDEPHSTVELDSPAGPATGPAKTAPAPPPEPASATSRPLVDQQGRAVRNWQLHEGSNRFFLGGRALTSRDNPMPFGLSLGVAVVMPALFFAFSGDYLWHNLGGGGKASLFIFAWLAAIMCSSMVSMTRGNIWRGSS